MSSIDSYIKRMVEKYHIEVENLTREQFEIALHQAIKSGDFVRATIKEHCPIESRQDVYYQPYNILSKVEDLEQKLSKCKEALEFYHLQYDVFNGYPDDDLFKSVEGNLTVEVMGRRAMETLKEVFPDE